MTGLLTWLLVADVVPWRSVLLSVTPLLGLWAGRALGSAADCLLEWHRLRREIRICVDWRDVKP